MNATAITALRSLSPEVQKASVGTSVEIGKAKTGPSDQTHKEEIGTSDQAHKAKIGTSDEGKSQAQKIGRLPEIPSLLSKPSKVLQELNNQISSLKEHLAEAEAHSHREVAHQKIEYEGVLEQQRGNSTSMEAANARIKQEILELMTSNTNLRKRAAELGKQGTLLHKKLATLQSNLSIAQEYLETTLRADPNDKVKLSVLHELDEQDELSRNSSEHESRLKQVSAAALLQLSTTTDGDPFQVVQALSLKFDELEREQKASMAVLKDRFDKDFDTEDLKQSNLKKEHTALLASKGGQMALNEKLRNAVTHLEKGIKFLKERIEGLQAFARKLSH